MPRQKIFLVGAPKNEITGSKLPSKRDVLSVLFYNMRNVKLNLVDSTSLVIDECLIFWKKARIPHRDRSHCLKQLNKLYNELRSLEKNKMRVSDMCRRREQDFKEGLDDLFDIAHANALNMTKIDEDKQFLLLQRQKGRPGCMLGKDMKLASTEQRKANRAEKEVQRKEKQSLELQTKAQIAHSSSSEEIKSNDSDQSVVEPVSENLAVPGPSGMQRARREILTPRLSAALDKCKISDRDAVHLLTACVEATLLNPQEFIINRTSLRKSRQYFREIAASDIKSKLVNKNLKFSVVHWDSKLLPNITGKEKVDRLPVIVTAPDVEQLLGVPELIAGTGSETSSAVYDTLEDWSLLHTVQAFVFDTTASNTGRLNGACVLLEQKLGRDILFLACRHHVYEIILQGVFIEAKVSSSSGPDIPLFKRFKSEWRNIDKTKFLIWTTDATVQEILQDTANEILEFAQKNLKENFPRDDYREFLEIIVIFLGGIPSGEIKFRPPGAYHLARWMAKAIYCLKIWLFRKQFKLVAKEEKAVQRICCFIIKCYALAWFSAPNAIDAPLNDINFIKGLYVYKEHDKEIAEVALKKILNHLWYFNEECAAFSLFDDRITNEQKRRMTEKMTYEQEDDDDEVRKKVYLQLEDVSNFICKDLPTDLLSSKSLKLFKRFGMSSEFLLKDPVHWKDQHDYKRGQEIIGSLRVVNDTAERGVKLIEEFNDKLTKNEEQKQFLLQAVQDYRRKYPGHSREILKKSYT